MSEAPIWSPSPVRVASTNLRRFEAFAGFAPPEDPGADTYERLWRWSVEHPEEFWAALWRFTGVVAEPREGGDPWEAVLVGGDRMAPPDPLRGPRWFTGTRLNFAENLLRYRDGHPALVSWNELGRRDALSYAELARATARVARGLRQAGVGPGDRVVGWLPNVPETVIAMLATTSIGAIWSSCSPDFGVQGVVDRFGQIGPKVFFCADGYRYAGRTIDCLGRAEAILAQLPGVREVVVVPHLVASPIASAIVGLEGRRRGARWWPDFLGPDDDPPLEFARLPFDHPVCIMYSSGTTGLPKCLVHGAGGTLLQHLKELVLHTDVRRGDRVFYFTTCGWMMWNWLVSTLATGAAVLLYDGAPLAPEADVLWDMADSERVSVFGTSARYIALMEKQGLSPARSHRLPALRTILSTGSPLSPAGFDYVYRDVKSDVQLASISGGTDIISCFALGNPLGPVWRGELQARGLGMAVDVFDEAGRSVRSQPGDLVCTRPFPSMPVAFWNDDGGRKYRAAYFERFEGAWTHGDWAELTEHGGLVIHGRSDATLNPGGVRIGTAELYREVERLPEVLESVAVGQEVTTGGEADVRIILFVRMRPGQELDDATRERLRQAIRSNLSPHHVPRLILEVPDIPRTVSGKISEVAVRETIHGRPVRNVEALANPEALEHYKSLEALHAGV
ncbi:MAG: acetoacetate--CoA ligase [Gemmatimonadales bacterium]